MAQPTFFIVETYRTMTVPMIIGGFGLGICAGAIVLSRIAQRTDGSVLRQRSGMPSTT
jgi:hypothetical protein